MQPDGEVILREVATASGLQRVANLGMSGLASFLLLILAMLV